MRRTMLATLFGFGAAFLFGFTLQTTPPRAPSLQGAQTDVPQLYIHDPNAAGATTVGIPNVVGKIVTCVSPRQSIGLYNDGGSVGLVCLNNRITFSSIAMTGAPLVAGTTLGGGTFLSDGTITSVVLEQLRFNIATPGAGGTADMVIRASAAGFGVTCDFGTPCNQAAGTDVPGGQGGAASCTFPSGAQIVYSVESIGDCVTGATIYGNADMDGYYQ